MNKALVTAFLLYCFSAGVVPTVSGQTAQPRLFAPGIVSTEFMETSATFTPDGKTVYFTRSDFQFTDNTILKSHFSSGKWREPEVASFSGIWRDSEPHVAPDGNKLFFVSNRPVKPGDKPLVVTSGNRSFPGANIWYVEKKETAGANPFILKARSMPFRQFTILQSPAAARFTFPAFCRTAKAKIRFIAPF